MDSLCPKCANAMIQYERNGVTIDQCTECKGIFLDRGELDRLIVAESSWHGPERDRSGGYSDHRHDDRRHDRHRDEYHDEHHGQHGHRGKKRRGRSFLEDLFDS